MKRISACVAFALCALCCSHGQPAKKKEALAAYRRGDFALAYELSRALAEDSRHRIDALELLVKVCYGTGRHEEAVAAFLGARAELGARLDAVTAAVWSCVRLDRFDDALMIVNASRAKELAPLGLMLSRMIESPLTVTYSGLEALPFTDDALSEYLPGISVTVAGKPVVARVDTGGSYLHVTRRMADSLGIKTFARERAFASLESDTVSYGLCDMTIGRTELRNVPVYVHEHGMSAEPIAEAFGIEIGPLLGTNLLSKFLATVDSPRKRIILSDPRDAGQSSLHEATLSPATLARTIPYILHDDHYLLAPLATSVGSGCAFVDSGLVMANESQGQVATLMPKRRARSLRVATPSSREFARITERVSIGGLETEGLTAYVVPNSVWDGFGSWDGIDVVLLLSYGFLRDYAWTIDPIRHEFRLHK